MLETLTRWDEGKASCAGALRGWARKICKMLQKKLIWKKKLLRALGRVWKNDFWDSEQIVAQNSQSVVVSTERKKKRYGRKPTTTTRTINVKEILRFSITRICYSPPPLLFSIRYGVCLFCELRVATKFYRIILSLAWWRWRLEPPSYGLCLNNVYRKWA